MIVRRRWSWRTFAHRRGWLASPAAAWRGVPFGPERRDLAGEVMARLARRHDPATCYVCLTPDEEWP